LPHPSSEPNNWLEVLKFNKHRNTFVLFDKKFSILN
jgi:hypothetical protein